MTSFGISDRSCLLSGMFTFAQAATPFKPTVTGLLLYFRCRRITNYHHFKTLFHELPQVRLSAEFR